MIRSTTKQRKSRWNRNKDTIFIVVLASIGEIASALSSSCALAIVRHHIYIIIVAIDNRNHNNFRTAEIRLYGHSRRISDVIISVAVRFLVCPNATRWRRAVCCSCEGIHTRVSRERCLMRGVFSCAQNIPNYSE